MNLHIILRTCSESNVHFSENFRFITVSKTKLILHCLRSLVLSLSRAKKSRTVEVTLTVVDDHSRADCVNEIKNILDRCPFKTKLIPLKETGNNASMKFCYEIGRDSTAELLYLVEDDYLNSLDCMGTMIDAYDYFKKKFLKNKSDIEVAIMPVDNMFHYFDESMFSSPLVLGPERHFRVNYYSNWTMMLSQQSILKHWNVWEAFSHYELAKPETHEDAILVPLFKEYIHLFTPVPTLALHVAGVRYESPFSDWQKMWRDVERAWSHFKDV